MGCRSIAAMSEHGLLMAEAVDKVAALVTRPDADGRRPIDDESVKYRLGRSVARMEAALSTPGMFGRVAIAQTMRDISADLMDILGAGIRVCRSIPRAPPTTAQRNTCSGWPYRPASTAAPWRCSAT